MTAACDSTLARAAALLDAVAAAGTLRFNAARRLLGDLAPASLQHVLRQMLAEGLLRRDHAGAYALGARPAAWRGGARLRLEERARPELEALSHDLQATACLWSRHGDSMRCRLCVRHEHAPALLSEGSVRPLHLSIIGAPLLLSAAERDDPARLAARPDAPGSRASAADRRRMLAQVARSGWWDDFGACYPHRRLAVAIDVAGEPPSLLGLGLLPGAAVDVAAVHARLAAAAARLAGDVA